MTTKTKRCCWAAILRESASIVDMYETGVTLRQLFYRLVVAALLPNTRGAYGTLSAQTAEARRRGEFPDLMDRTRTIHRDISFDGPGDARQWLGAIYRRDRTEGQEHSVYLGVEKHGLVELLRSWFGRFGLPILALGGYSSQTYVKTIVEDVEAQDRPAVLLYAGDFDPSGIDIGRDFVKRSDCWAYVDRVALTQVQIAEHNLPAQMGKATDSRAAGFVQEFGELVQVELDALPPDVLRDLYRQRLDSLLDMSVLDAVVRREQREKVELIGG